MRKSINFNHENLFTGSLENGINDFAAKIGRKTVSLRITKHACGMEIEIIDGPRFERKFRSLGLLFYGTDRMILNRKYIENFEKVAAAVQVLEAYGYSEKISHR